jgi:hypothetical protein
MRRPIAATIVGVTLAAAACAPSEPDAPTTASAVIANRNVDLLFMIDNSSSMRPSQTNLTTSFPMFMDAVNNLPGGPPNLHVAVVSSDMGAGDGSITGCTRTGDAGKFHFLPTATCSDTTIVTGAGYISYTSAGAGNFTAPDISTVFSCIAALGDTGCGFERPFASVLRALGADGMPVPSENAGFLRSDALLAIVMVTNEDDCSARDGVNLYDVASNTLLSSELGPPTNYRCNELGHLCDGTRPPRLAPGGDVNATVTLNNCGSSECDGSLIPVAEFAARIKALKTAPASDIMVAAITGPATPYTVHWKTAPIADSGPWPEIGHSCMAADGSFADPAVRITDMVTAFGANGALYPICDTNFGPALQQLAARIGTLLAAGGGTGGSAGRIPSCGMTGLGGHIAAGAGGSRGGSGGAGGSAVVEDAGIGTPPLTSSACGCRTGGPNVSGLGLGVALNAWLAARRRRASSGPSRGLSAPPSRRRARA